MALTFIPLVMVVLIILLVPVLASRIRLWSYLHLYRRIQRDFFRNRVTFVPEHDTPIPQPLADLYNFIEAEQFIAVLSDPDGSDRDKTLALETIGAVQGMIKRQQQKQLKSLLAEMLAYPDPPTLTTLLPGALFKLDQAVLID